MSKKGFYPEQARSAKRAAKQLGLKFIDIDSGYLFEISNGKIGFLSGAGHICTYPLNTAVGVSVAADKLHTNSVLARKKIPVIPSKLFFLDENYKNLREAGREGEDAIRYLSKLKLPVFCKPNRGSRGNFAEIINSQKEFVDYMGRVRRYYDSFLVQPVMNGTEYRVFCVDGKAMFYTQKAPPFLVGDGVKTVKELVEDFNAKLKGYGISSITAHNPKHKPKKDEVVVLEGRRNIASQGSAKFISKKVPKKLADIALKAMKEINLSVAGVDIFDVSKKNDLSKLVIIEVNGNASLTSLEKAGEHKLIDDIWQAIIKKYFQKNR